MARTGLALEDLLVGLLTWALVAPHAVRAQEPIGAVVFRTASAVADMDVAAAVDPLVIAEVNERSDLRVVERPALDLQATQIAIDCVGETPACLNAVLRQYEGASVLIAPSIQRADEETVVTFLYFDPRQVGEFRTVVARYRGADVAQQALDAVPSMLRELLDPNAKAASESVAAEADASGGTAPALRGGASGGTAPALRGGASGGTAPALRGGASAPESEPPSPAPVSHVAAAPRAFPLVPVVLFASAAVAAGVGIAFGVAADRSRRAYHQASTHDDDAVDAAIALRERAHSEAWVANVSFGVAAAVFALGTTLLVVDLATPERATVSASGSSRATVSASGSSRATVSASGSSRATVSALVAPGRIGVAVAGPLPRGW